MNKEKQIIVPELRFKDFQSNKEWKSPSIQSLIDNEIIISHLDGNHGALYPRSEEFTDQGVPYVTANDFVNGYVDFSNSKRLPLERAKKFKKGVSINGDILFAHNATVGPVAKLKTDLDFVILSTTATYFRCDNIELINDFLKHSLCSSYFVKQYSRVMSQSTRNQVPITTQRKFFLFLPNPKEQEKIANCLSSLDNLITAETEKLDYLKDHKKGLLQQLFPANGETKPQFRFSEFINDGDWEEKCVDDYFEVGSSKRVLQKDWTNKGVPFYRTRELVSLSKNKPFGSEIYISEELFLELSEKYGVPKKGDFLVSGVGTLGILYQVKENDKFYFKDGNVIWFKLVSGIESDYFKHCFHTKFFQKQIFGQSSASTVGTYTISNARKTKFWKPVKKEEQQKIANCLSSADDLIQAQKIKITSFKKHKKGLMQQLFPNII